MQNDTLKQLSNIYPSSSNRQSSSINFNGVVDSRPVLQSTLSSQIASPRQTSLLDRQDREALAGAQQMLQATEKQPAPLEKNKEVQSSTKFLFRPCFKNNYYLPEEVIREEIENGLQTSIIERSASHDDTVDYKLIKAEARLQRREPASKVVARHLMQQASKRPLECAERSARVLELQQRK